MENEIMNNVEVIEDVVETVYDEGNGVGFGTLTLAAAAGYLLVKVTGKAISWGKNKLANRKAKKTEGVLKFENVEAKTDDEEVTVE